MEVPQIRRGLSEDYTDVWEAEENIGNYLTFYNNGRYHSALDYKTPREVYFNGKRNLKAGMDK